MASDWTLVEYRPGRYVRISPTGVFLGKATEREVRAWFAARGGLLTMAPEPVEPASPEPESLPEGEDEESPPPTVGIAAPPAAARNDGVGSSAPEMPEREARPKQAPTPQVEIAAPPTMEIATPPVAARNDVVDSSPAPPEARELAADAGDGVGRWLWVDPRQESGYQLSSFDLEAFLKRAIALFQSKDWARGQRPGRLAVHPGQRADDLQPLADALGLEVVGDPLVSPGTYRLGLAELRTGARAPKRH